MPEPRAQIEKGLVFCGQLDSTDVRYHAIRPYYGMGSKMPRSHPSLLLNVSNDRGPMVDFGCAAHGNYFVLRYVVRGCGERRRAPGRIATGEELVANYVERLDR